VKKGRAATGRTGIAELARRLDLSVSTVSRALNGYDDVNAETRRRVVDAARAHNYVPSAGALRLRHGRTNTVGFVFSPLSSEFIEPFYIPLLAGIDEGLRALGYDLFVTVARPGDEEAQIFPRLVEGHRVDAVLFARTRPDDWRIRYCQERRFPFAALGRSDGILEPYPCIDLDYDAVAHTACRRFLADGHRRLGILLPPPDLMVATFMRRGCGRAVAEGGPATDATIWTFDGDQTAGGGVRAAAALAAISPGERPTAIVCGSDVAAIGLMGALGLAVSWPDGTFSVIGCGDNVLAPLSDPPLTTFRFPLSRIGRDLVDVLAPLLGQGEAEQEPGFRLASPELVVRESDRYDPVASIRP
jgi:LacI family transcriptional regulator